MRDEAVVVAVEQAPEAVRALAFDAAGRCVAAAACSIGASGNALGHLEYDLHALAEALRAALDSLARDVPAARWQALGLAAEGGAVAALNRANGQPLAPAIAARDQRNLPARPPDLGATAVEQWSGRAWTPQCGAARLRWWLDHVPAVRGAAAGGQALLGPLASGLLFLTVTGRPWLADAASAAALGLWSPAAADWGAELVAGFGLPRPALPACVPVVHAFGALRVAGAPVPVAACATRELAELYAAGAPRADAACLHAGAAARALVPVADARIALPLATVPLADEAGGPRHALQADAGPALGLLDALVARHGGDTARLLLALEGCALPAVEAPLCLAAEAAGEPAFDGRGETLELAAAVLESVAFRLRAALDDLRRHAPAPALLVVSGRLAASRWLCRLLATLAGVPVERRPGDGLAARGIAWLAAGSPAGWLRAPAGERIAPEAQEAVLARYLRWLATPR